MTDVTGYNLVKEVELHVAGIAAAVVAEAGLDLNSGNLTATIDAQVGAIAPLIVEEAGLDLTTTNLVAAITAKAPETATALVTEVLKAAYLNSTTAALGAASNAINTTGKHAGKCVFNTTTGLLVQAAGALSLDVWRNVKTGAVAHSPI